MNNFFRWLVQGIAFLAVFLGIGNLMNEPSLFLYEALLILAIYLVVTILVEKAFGWRMKGDKNG